MSSFTEYHKKWKEENGKGEDSQYKQRSMDEILESTDRYLANKFNNNENMWDKVQSVANNNLNNSNNMQNMLNDINKRNQMAKTVEDYTNAKRTSMQAVSNAIQGNNNNKYLPLTTQVSNDNESKDINVMSKKGREELISSIKKQIGKSIGEKILEFSSSSGNHKNVNNIKIYRDNLGQIDRNKTAVEMAKNKTKRTLQMLERRKAYAEAQKEMDEKLKDSWQYRNVQMQNPNATEEELIKLVRQRSEENKQKTIEKLADMQPGERNRIINIFMRDTRNKDGKLESRKTERNELKARVQAVETQREADKINQDIQNGKYGSSVGHILKGVPEGGINALAKTIATMESISPVGREEFVDAVKLQSRKYQETTSKIDNKAVQTASGVSNTIGEMTPAILASLATSGAGTAVSGAGTAVAGAGTASKVGGIVNAVNVGSSGYLEALNEDNSNKGQAGITGILKGTASYGIEKITGGNFLSKGSLDDIAKQTISSKFSSETAKKVASKIYEFGGETLEENLENQVGYVIDKVVNNQNITAEQWANDFKETTKNTILTTAVLNLLGLGGDTYKEIVDIEKNTKAKEMIKEVEKIIKKENLEINADTIKERELRSVFNQVNVKENGQDNNIINKSNSQILENRLANGQKTRYNDFDLGEVKNVPIEDVLQFKTDGGYRDKQYMAELREDIRKNGIDNPIELVRNSDGSIGIENGNHRLQVANELGLKEVPIKFVESWDSVLGNIDRTENKVVERLEVYNDRNNGNRGETNIFDGGSRTNEEYSTNNWNQLKNRGTTTRNDRLYSQIQTFTDRPSSNSTFEQNFKKKQELGDTSSFDLQNNNFNLQQNITNNPINSQTNQITQVENKVAQNGNMEQIDSIANNGQTVYNNTESEGGISGEKIRQRNRDVFEQSTNEINTESQTTINAREGFEKRFNVESEGGINEESRRTKQDDKRRVQELFEKYERGKTNGASNIKELFRNQETRGITEQEVKKTLIDYANKYSKTELNENEIKLKNIINNLGGNVVFYEYGNNNIFEGLADKSTFYIDTLSESKTNNIFYHELTHFLRQNNNEIYMKEIQPIVEKIASDFNYQEAIFNYANSSGEYFDVRKLDGSLQIELAEEVVADQIASIYGDLEADYGIDSKIKEQLKTSMDKILNYNENIQVQTNTTNQLKEVEDNTQSLGYKPDTEGKQRKHYKSVMESDQVGEVGKQSAKSLLENDTYKPLSNIDTLATANESINRNGVDNTYIAFRSKLNSNERITLQDIATGERLIQIFSQNGDIEKVNGLIQDVAMLGTELGQQVQAMSLIKKASPEGQLMYLQKVVERTNIKENTDLQVTNEMSKKILESKSRVELENVMTDIAVELGEQLPVTTRDKVRSWRYLSMLGNPKTHIKNLGANVAMNVTQQIKNKVAGATEDIVGIFNKDMERTKTLKFANKDQKSFAKQDAEFMKDKIDGGGKYDIKNAIQSNKRQFDNKTLNAIADFNSNMLELEDNIFLKKAYQQAMQNYMSANKLSSSDMENSSILQKAREYASYQAQEATFHQFSELAKRLTEIENKGGIAGKVLEAVIPFKKTPINIAKSGVEYSPIGLVKSLSYDLAQLNKKTKDYKSKLEKGIISKADYKTGTSKLATKTIDNMAKGLTGTSLAILGYALADMGLLKSGNDGDDDEFKEKLGEQEYAIRIGDNTYTLDWVSPSAIPMFMGATVHDLMHSEDEDNSNTLNSLMTSSAKALEPMTEMSMLQGLTSAISSYEQGSSNMLFDLGASATTSYLGQFVPTALGQVAKTIDDKERDTSSTEKGLAKKVDQFKKQQMAKIPIASKLLPVRKDVWGNEKTRDSNPLMRAYEVGLAPYNRKKVVEDYTENELLKVFEDTGEKSVLPGIPNKDITINKQKYRLTAEEYNKVKETFGKTSKSMLDGLVKTKEYKQLSDEQKVVAIDNIYSYAKEKIKVDYAKGKKQEVETSSSYNILNELKKPTNQSEYLSYSAKIQGIEKDTEKKEILANGKYSEITKETIYKNTLGKEDDLYNNILAKDNININEYLNYKLQKFESDKEDDGTVKGKSIKGSRPKKLYDYVNNMNITKNQKLAIIGTQCKLDRNEQRELYNYINNIPGQTQKERLEMFSKYSSNFIVNKDNTINIK